VRKEREQRRHYPHGAGGWHRLEKEGRKMLDRKVVIRLAREAGYDDAESHSGRLRAFAFLVMAEACNKMVDDMPNSEIVKAAIEDEREACAKVCEAEGERVDASWVSCAFAIRERGAP
jgi:hypothetical protein